MNWKMDSQALTWRSCFRVTNSRASDIFRCLKVFNLWGISQSNYKNCMMYVLQGRGILTMDTKQDKSVEWQCLYTFSHATNLPCPTSNLPQVTLYML